MSFWENQLLSSLISAIVGLLIGIIFEDYLKNIIRNIQRRIKRMFNVSRRTSESHLFSINGKDSNFFVIEGDGIIEFERDNIECRLIEESPTLPEDLQIQKAKVEKAEHMKKVQGLKQKWNGQLYGLSKYIPTRVGDSENPAVVFHFHLTDYYTFLATNMQLDHQLASGETIRKKYIPTQGLEKVQPLLANGFGVALVIITSNEKLIMVKRANTSGVRSNELDVSVVEGVHPTFDKDPFNDGPNLFKAAVRGAYEELGLEINPKEIRFLGYGIDMGYYQWNIIGHVHIKETVEEVISIRSRGSSDKWENKQVIFENFTANNIAHLIVNKPMWSTAKVALYWTAVKHLGKNNVERAIRQLTK